jgi:hypothetical protein
MKKEEPENQKQHKVSQVYLKHFGYKKNEEFWLSILEIGKTETENIRVNDFTIETNIFDLPFEDFEIRRGFENMSNQIENHYNILISNLHNQKQLNSKDTKFLYFFVANILCRTNPFRNFINGLLTDNLTREKFISEISHFSNDKKDIEFVLNYFEKENQLNIILETIMHYLANVFKHFNKVFIKDFNNIGWLTTDSPVHLDTQGKYGVLIPIESEIYLPLSKDFCLFMYHPSSEIQTNPLRSLKKDKINEIDFDTFDKVTKKITFDYDKYLVFNTEFEPTKIELNKKYK